MRRQISRNRRLAVVSASSASILAVSSSLLPQAHSTSLSPFAHGVGVGLLFGASLTLSGLSFLFLRRDRRTCART